MDQRASHHLESSHRVEPFAGLAFCLIFPSLGVIQKYSGNLGLAAYVVMTPMVLWVAFNQPGSYSWVSDRTASITTLSRVDTSVLRAYHGRYGMDTCSMAAKRGSVSAIHRGVDW